MLILKQMFKKMDPTIMRTATYASHGDVQLSFKYDHQQQVLLVQVIRGRDLQAKDLRGKTSDPYVLVSEIRNANVLLNLDGCGHHITYMYVVV